MDKIELLKTETILGLTLLARRRAVVETQTIEQFLVSKGICTIDEFRDMRKRVETNSAEVKELDREIAYNLSRCQALSDDVANIVKFSSTFSKALDGDELTEAEHELLKKALYGEGSDPE